MALIESCPNCGDDNVTQQNIDGEVYWTARGWPDSHTGHNVAIEYCPFCGEELLDDESAPESGEAA